MSFRTIFTTVVVATVLPSVVLADGIMVMDPYARAASPAAKTGAVFMMVKNETGQDDRLVAVRSDAAVRVELHTHIETGDGILQMTRIEGGIDLPAGETHHMKRGGDHVMLMGLTGPLEQGGEIEVVLVFEGAGEVVVTIPVDNARKPEAGARSGG